MIGRIPIAFVAGMLSFLAPCVLPLVPGYLSTVSAVDPAHLGERGTALRVVRGSIPFFAGFTALFVALGAGAGALGDAFSFSSLVVQEVAGFVVVVFGLAYAGLLPFPERLVAPALVGTARNRGSSVVLGAAFAVCAAPCVGPVLGSILALAADASTAAKGSVLLLAYSAGLAVPFVLTGVAFTRAMGAFRWLRDHYAAIRVASGAVLVTIGLLLFFDRFWWVQAGLKDALDAVGLDL